MFSSDEQVNHVARSDGHRALRVGHHVSTARTAVGETRELGFTPGISVEEGQTGTPRFVPCVRGSSGRDDVDGHRDGIKL